jgi:diadenosine tetraphosphatase ApaH/serine/threonine PP2A family protein phosphatase
MRIALLADIHANLEALVACREAARSLRVDRTAYLGDIVGYGADPRACLEIVRADCAAGAAIVRGNHDEAMGESGFRMGDAAGEAVAWTRAALSTEEKDYLRTLPLTVREEDRLFVHSSARDPGAFPYVRALADAASSLAATDARLTVIGHVHQPALYNMTVTGKVIGFIPISEAPIPLSSQRRWLAVMGAVGQPRDGNPAAAFGLLDTARRELSFVRVPYDVEKTAARIRAAGLPDSLWKRLAIGR